MSFKDDLNNCACGKHWSHEDNNTYDSDCVTKYKCRVCGKVFDNISDCVRHEYNCLQKQEEEIKKVQQQKEFEERQIKLTTKKTELKDVENEILEAWNNYIDKKNKKAKIQKEINELEFGKENFDTIKTFLDIFNL